jgi:hypothetical protein
MPTALVRVKVSCVVLHAKANQVVDETVVVAVAAIFVDAFVAVIVGVTTAAAAIVALAVGDEQSCDMVVQH